MYQEAIREKDPEVLEKQRIILATPGLASAFSIPGAQWITAALSAMELPQAVKKGYDAYQNHNYYELYDQMLNGMFSTLGMIPAATASAKMISKFNKNDKLINHGQLIHDFGFYEPVDGAIKASDAVGKANYLRALQEAREYMSSGEVMDAAKRSNRVAKMLYEKDPVKYPFKDTNIQVGPANTKVVIEPDPTIPTRGKYIGQNNGEGVIKINPEYHPKIKDKAADMVVGLDKDKIEDYNTASSRKNKILNRVYKRYARKYNNDKFLGLPYSEVLKLPPKEQER